MGAHHVLASLWNTNNGPPALEGNLLNFVNEPNRYGLPAFYELHVWAFQDNPQRQFRGLEFARGLRQAADQMT